MAARNRKQSALHSSSRAPRARDSCARAAARRRCWSRSTADRRRSGNSVAIASILPQPERVGEGGDAARLAAATIIRRTASGLRGIERLGSRDAARRDRGRPAVARRAVARRPRSGPPPSSDVDALRDDQFAPPQPRDHLARADQARSAFCLRKQQQFQRPDRPEGGADEARDFLVGGIAGSRSSRAPSRASCIVPARTAFYAVRAAKASAANWLIARLANFWGGFFHPSAMLPRTGGGLHWIRAGGDARRSVE